MKISLGSIINKKEKHMSSHIISYKGEMVNLDNVIYAKPLQDSGIKLFVIGSAGAGNQNTYSVQHREINIYWPRKVWEELCEKAGVIFASED